MSSLGLNRWRLAGLAVAFVAGIWLILAVIWNSDHLPHVEPVPAGDVEVVWFHNVTSIAAWERLAAAARKAARQVPGLTVDESFAFPEQTRQTPELLLGREGVGGRVRIRWYRLSSQEPLGKWLDALAVRHPPPLAIVGGDTSARAAALAQELAARQNRWTWAAPLLFLTTATADTIAGVDGREHELIQFYPGRTFRCCFSNRQMARGLLDFLFAGPEHGVTPRGEGPSEPENWPTLVRVWWMDDPYSRDLFRQFESELDERKLKVRLSLQLAIVTSVGGLYRANPAEMDAAERILQHLPTGGGQRSVLVLPTATGPARRLLRALCGNSPLIGKYLVAVNGDAINLNALYRDAGLTWDMTTLPVPLVCFAHDRPDDWDEHTPEPSSTDELNLKSRLVRILADALLAVDGLRSDPETVRVALQAWGGDVPFFEPDGQRRAGLGEYIICLRPHFSDDTPSRVSPIAHLDIWQRTARTGWRRTREQSLPVPPERR